MRISLEVETAPAGAGKVANVIAAAANAARVRLNVDILDGSRRKEGCSGVDMDAPDGGRVLRSTNGRTGRHPHLIHTTFTVFSTRETKKLPETAKNIARRVTLCRSK